MFLISVCNFFIGTTWGWKDLGYMIWTLVSAVLLLYWLCSLIWKHTDEAIWMFLWGLKCSECSLKVSRNMSQQILFFKSYFSSNLRSILSVRLLLSCLSPLPLTLCLSIFLLSTSCSRLLPVHFELTYIDCVNNFELMCLGNYIGAVALFNFLLL